MADGGYESTATLEAEQVKADQRAAHVGVVATRLAEALQSGDVVYIALDEQRAEAVAAALQAAAPEAQVAHSPSSDALPGETGAASPSNVGRRVAAFRAARMAQQRKDGPPLAFITTAEAAATGYPAPAVFDQAPPLVAVDDELDLASFADMLESIGYFADDRVDEPGEMAAHGQVIDLFPADSPNPFRIEVDGGRVGAIRRYDPVSQLSEGSLEYIEVGRVVEPAVGSNWTTLFDHMPKAAVAIDPGASVRRDRYIALAREVAHDGSEGKIVDAAAWDEALVGRTRVDVAPPSAEAIPRFVEGKAPLRAFGRFAKAALADGERIVLLGADRDLRFLSPRIAKAAGVSCETITAWREVAARAPNTIAMLAMPIDRGWRSDGVTVLAAADLLGGRALGDREAARSADPLRGELGEIRLGDVVVHEDFGIGRVAGVESMAGGSSGDAGDAIALGYAGGGRRLVSVHDADRLWRYGADADAVTLDKLDGSSWEKRRIAIDAAIAESARGLTELATERGKRTAPPLVPDVAANHQ